MDNRQGDHQSQVFSSFLRRTSCKFSRLRKSEQKFPNAIEVVQSTFCAHRLGWEHKTRLLQYGLSFGNNVMGFACATRSPRHKPTTSSSWVPRLARSFQCYRDPGLGTSPRNVLKCVLRKNAAGLLYYIFSKSKGKRPIEWGTAQHKKACLPCAPFPIVLNLGSSWSWNPITWVPQSSTRQDPVGYFVSYRADFDF
jgi:hypothetical protein